MNRKKFFTLLILGPFLLLSYLFLGKFEFLMIFTVMLSGLTYAFLKDRSHLKTFEKIFNIYKLILSITSGIFLIIFSYILYNGNKYSQVKVVNGVEYILVLGSRLKDDEVTDVLKMRLDKALEYHQIDKNVKFIVSGGPADASSISEAHAMKEYLNSFGVEASDIILEDEAQSTFDNIKFTKEILDNKDVLSSKILIVTSDFHISRAMMISNFFDIDAYGLSSGTPVELKMNYIIREILAFLKDFCKSYLYKLGGITC